MNDAHAVSSEAEAILRAQAGDESAFTELYERHKSTVLKHCFAILKNRDAAEDASQEVFLKLFRKIGTFRGESKFSVWLCALTRSVCFTLLREQKRDLPSASMVLPDVTHGACRRGVRKMDGDPLEAIPARDLGVDSRAALNETFTRLPEESKVALNAYFVHGHTVEQVCRKTHTHARAFYDRRRKAERALRRAAVTR